MRNVPAQKTDEFEHTYFLAPGPGRCPVCAGTHDQEQPHNKDSFYYRMKFWQKHGRYPNWIDAMEHCPPDVKQWWMEELRRRGIKPEEVRNDEQSAEDTP